MITQTEIIEVLKMQSILNGVICLLVALIGASGLYGSSLVIRSGLKSTDNDTKRWLVTSGVLLSAVALGLFCVFLWMGLTRVANPGMAAIDYVIRNAQGKIF
jgi:hypothetical protein